MGLSAGTGSPIRFRCIKCRSTVRNPYDRNARAGIGNSGKGYSVTLTGRQRVYRSSWGSALGQRSTNVSREYKCQDCGHVGWSNHGDLAPPEERRGRRRILKKSKKSKESVKKT